MVRILCITLICFLLSSCQDEGRIFVEHQELSPDVEWLLEDSKEFKVTIEDDKSVYDLSLAFRYATGYQFQYAKIKVTETSPSGVTKVSDYDLKVREDNGDYIGDPGFDIWDSEHLVEKSKKFSESGTYTYLIEHNMPKDPLYYAMEIGLIVDKSN